MLGFAVSRLKIVPLIFTYPVVVHSEIINKFHFVWKSRFKFCWLFLSSDRITLCYKIPQNPCFNENKICVVIDSIIHRSLLYAEIMIRYRHNQIQRYNPAISSLTIKNKKRYRLFWVTWIKVKFAITVEDLSSVKYHCKFIGNYTA